MGILRWTTKRHGMDYGSYSCLTFLTVIFLCSTLGSCSVKSEEKLRIKRSSEGVEEFYQNNGRYMKRPQRFSFGLGKRSVDLDDYEYDLEGGEQKRDPYQFGLGKRSQNKREPYAFGLGKRTPYQFGLGKREPYAFGLGKRSYYGFGLGKREPYAFGLGRR